MITVDFPHQHRIIAPGQYIETWRVPCEGTISRVEGMIIIVAKDYTNQPTVSQLDFQLNNQLFLLMPDARLNFAATLAGLAVAPVTSLKDTDVGIPVFSIVTAGGGDLVITVAFTVVPDPFMLYIRPQLRITGMKDAPQAPGGREETTVPDPEALWPKPFGATELHMVEPASRQQVTPGLPSQVGQVDVVVVKARERKA